MPSGALPQPLAERRGAEGHDGEHASCTRTSASCEQLRLEDRMSRETEDDAQRGDEQTAPLREEQRGHRDDQDVERRESGRTTQPAGPVTWTTTVTSSRSVMNCRYRNVRLSDRPRFDV